MKMKGMTWADGHISFRIISANTLSRRTMQSISKREEKISISLRYMLRLFIIFPRKMIQSILMMLKKFTFCMISSRMRWGLQQRHSMLSNQRDLRFSQMTLRNCPIMRLLKCQLYRLSCKEA